MGYANVGGVVANYTGSAVTSVTVDPSTPTWGAAIATGDLMFLTVTGAAGVAMTNPSGWNLAGKGTFGTRTGAVYYRLRQSGDTSYTVTIPSSNGAQATLSWGRGHDPALVGLVVGVFSTRPSALVYTDIAGVTSTVDGSTIVTISLEATSASESDITSATFGSKVFFAPQTTSPQIHTTYLNQYAQTTAGATGTNRITYPGSAVANGAGIQIAVPPASAVNNAPTAQFAGVRTGMTAQFTDQSADSDGTIVGWAWDFGDGATATTQNPSHLYTAAGTYTVQLTVTDDDGDTGTISHTITVPSTGETVPAGFDLYDNFARYADGTQPTVALTGQTWGMFSPPGYVTGGRMDSQELTGAHYLWAAEGAAIRHMKGVFRFDTMGGTRTGNGGTFLLMVVDDIANVSGRHFRAHLALAPSGMTLATNSPGGSLNTIGSAGFTTSKDVDHTLELFLDGNTATCYVDGVLRLTVTDPTLVDTAGDRQAVFESYYNTDGTDSRARYSEVWANATARTGTGTVTLGGTGTATAAYARAGAGTVTLDGTGQAAVAVTGVGTVTLGGSGDANAAGGAPERTGTGTVTLGGTGTAVAREIRTGAGSVTLGGSAAAAAREMRAGAGTLTLTGSGAAGARVAAEGIGTITLTGTGTATTPGDTVIPANRTLVAHAPSRTLTATIEGGTP